MTRKASGLAAGRWCAVVAALMVFALDARAAATCSISVSGPNFLDYDPTATAADTARSDLLVTCTWTGGGTTNLSITSSFSPGNSGSFPNRYMLSGTQRLNYNLYFESTFTRIRGNGTAGTFTGGPASVSVSSANRTATASGEIWGRVPAGQDVAPGVYTDNIVVTINY